MATPYFTLKGISKKNAVKNKTKCALILLKYNCPDGGRYVSSIGEKIQVQYWSFKHGCATSAYTEVGKDGNPVTALDFNNHLNKLSAQITNAVRDMRTQNTAITKESLERFLAEQKEINTEAAKEKLNLLEFMDKFILECEKGMYKEIGKARIGRYSTLNKILIEYNKKKEPVTFGRISAHFYRRFETYLRTECRAQTGKKRGEPLALNYIGSLIKAFKALLTRASNDDRCDFSFAEDVKKQFKADSEEVDAVGLTEAQMKLVYEFDLSEYPEYLQRERDAFVLVSWLGLRSEDSKRINPDKIIEKNQGSFIKIRPHKTWKTTQEVVIPLHPWAHEILKRYDYHHPHPISNQKSNQYIKEVFEVIGSVHPEFHRPVTITYTRGGKPFEETREFCQWVGTHTRRRFFAMVWIRKPYKVDPMIIRMVGGWKSEKQFMTYVKLTSEEWAELLMDKITESGVFMRVA